MTINYNFIFANNVENFLKIGKSSANSSKEKNGKNRIKLYRIIQRRKF